MKTRIRDLGPGRLSFQYAEGKRPQAGDWHFVGGHASPATWPTQEQREKARACFTHRRSVEAALADLMQSDVAPAGVQGRST